MFSTVITGALRGVRAYLVHVEVDIARGLPGFHMVGSLSGEVREARERVEVALKNSGLELPPMKITVNLSPADVRKEGTAFDLPIAVGMLESLSCVEGERVRDTLFLGELGLNGEIKPVRGVLPIVREAAERGIRQCVVPMENASEGAVIPGIRVRGVPDVRTLLAFLQMPEEAAEKLLPVRNVNAKALFGSTDRKKMPDFREVIGQEAAKRAAEIAAAGFHNLLMIGPPGAGKSMIAKRIPGIMPPLTLEESLEVSSVYSVAGLLREPQGLVTERPFQSPHHTITEAALVGGCSIPRPGVMSLAHRGVLFLDELPEFSRVTLDSMRQPLEERQVHIARVQGSVSYPACFMLVCAMNPCVCGYYPDRNRCACTEAEVKRYLGRVSGPLVDRMDLCVEILPVDVTRVDGKRGEESSADIRRRVLAARQVQEERYRGTGYHFNGEIGPLEVARFCPLGPAEQELAQGIYHTLQLSARAYHRILKVSRTIADLAGADAIGTAHLEEACLYRIMDHTYWSGRGDAGVQEELRRADKSGKEGSLHGGKKRRGREAE